MSYYFDDGVLKTNFNPVDAKISELNDDGYGFDRLEFLVDTLGGIGAGGALDFFEQFYNAANEIYQQNSLACDLLILNLPTIKKLFSKVFDIIQNNLHYYDSFVQGLKFQSEHTLDSSTKALHVKTVVLLSYKKPDNRINVKVEFGDGERKVLLDNIAKRAEEYKLKERVTYKMIKEYIEAKYGFKVHTAYIAEVKRDLGLPIMIS